jgi:hypothetical protein
MNIKKEFLVNNKKEQKRVLGEQKKEQKKFSISSNNARNTQRILRLHRQLSRWTNGPCDYLNLEQSIL